MKRIAKSQAQIKIQKEPKFKAIWAEIKIYFILENIEIVVTRKYKLQKTIIKFADSVKGRFGIMV